MTSLSKSREFRGTMPSSSTLMVCSTSETLGAPMVLSSMTRRFQKAIAY